MLMRLTKIMFLICGALAVQFALAETEKKPVLWIAISSPGGDKAYVISINDIDGDCIYDVKFGRGFKLSNGKYSLSTIKQEKRVTLSQTAWARLNKRISSIEGVQEIEKLVVKDDWHIVVKTEERSFEVFYGKLSMYPKPLSELIQDVIILSPIKIDLHGFS